MDDLDPYSGDVGPFDDDDAYDDIPWADPAIRKDYEAALGGLILAHNDLDRHLTLLIGRCLKKLGDPPELERLKRGMFFNRLENLETLNAVTPELRLRGLDFAELKELNRQRNIVAHGHFEQDPHYGDYQLITNKQTHTEFSTERLREITKRIDKQVNQLKPLVWFYDVVLPPLPIAPKPR